MNNVQEKKQAKVGLATWITLGVLAVATILLFVFAGSVYGENSVFNREVSQNVAVNTLYQKIPALFKSIQIVTIAWIVSWGGRTLLHKLLARTNRSKTIVKLINNFLKYLIALIALFMVLGAWGVDTRTLLAGAGILSLIIGLGAQSLIADIFAGIFIVFENEFQVGDIVIIDGWRGTVDEIGIRATKIIDWQGNIKIVNNSEISTIINQSKELSITTCEISIGYGESIPHVELVIKNNLERIRKAIPEIVEGPFYKGVNNLGASSVDLLFVATVKEADFFAVRRALNRELKIIFDENNINIPFPQVTVSYLDEGEAKTARGEKTRANRFAAEQREASKDLEQM